MAIIDPDGLFGGDRLRQCSNEAQLHWPRLYLASDGFGRLEINYARIIGRAYATFNPVPSQTELKSWIQEYHDRYLLFLYDFAGQIWGAWDTKPENLPRYKTASDKRSPVPPEPAFAEWRRSYRALGRSVGGIEFRGLPEVKPVAMIAPPEDNQPALFGDAPRQVNEAAKPAPIRSNWMEMNHEHWYRNAFWNHVGKEASKKAYGKRIKALIDKEGMSADAAAEFLFQAATDDRKRFEHTPDWEWRVRLNPATWLNGCRWDDQPARKAVASVAPRRKSLIEELAEAR